MGIEGGDSNIRVVKDSSSKVSLSINKLILITIISLNILIDFLYSSPIPYTFKGLELKIFISLISISSI